MSKSKLTDKQRAFVKAKLETPGISNYQAAIKANYSPNTAHNSDRDILAKPGIREYLDHVAPDEKLAFRLGEGVDGEKTDQFSGEKLPDLKTRLDYIKEILELKGYKTVVNLQQFNVGGDLGIEFIKE